ncbi:NUDIX domain-containing protein [Paracoccus sediminis]|uniref:8-oxo-dGTP diphosphatase n=1 Tax=Paracoccus sediminis TaxID=1214787 RepID=A0A238VWH3_9RHOB|nr:NUDIX hydrolase [Paracoccus sediminis]TBN51362.1 NUDIX domain-containing protein [Paracoccus sediminis]SNR38636.1 8-oxo-dGTP diphosphatase [Paracoccus sediminis]
MIRRFGNPPRPAQRYRLRPGAYGLLVRDGRLLLTHQSAPDPEYQLPGGGIDAGESGLRALHREVFEETGWTIGQARRLGSYRRFAFMPEYGWWAEKLCHVWLARPALRLSTPTETHHRSHWASPRAALDLLTDPGSRAFLERASNLIQR